MPEIIEFEGSSESSLKIEHREEKGESNSSSYFKEEDPELELSIPNINKTLPSDIFVQSKFPEPISEEITSCDTNISILNNPIKIKTKQSILQHCNEMKVSNHYQYNPSPSVIISNVSDKDHTKKEYKSKLSPLPMASTGDVRNFNQVKSQFHSFIETKVSSLVHIEGYLHKKSRKFFKGTKKMYCVLKSGIFKAYSNYDIKKTSLVFKLDEERINYSFYVNDKVPLIEFQYFIIIGRFRINSLKKDYTFCAPTNEMSRLWIETINTNIQFSKPGKLLDFKNQDNYKV